MNNNFFFLIHNLVIANIFIIDMLLIAFYSFLMKFCCYCLHFLFFGLLKFLIFSSILIRIFIEIRNEFTASISSFFLKILAILFSLEREISFAKTLYKTDCFFNLMLLFFRNDKNFCLAIFPLHFFPAVLFSFSKLTTNLFLLGLRCFFSTHQCFPVKF